MNRQASWIKIATLYRSPNGTHEDFQLTFDAEDFEIPEIQGKVEARGQFMRVEEGIMMLIKDIEATELQNCTRCQKQMKSKLSFKPSEWLFYDQDPHEDDASNEWLKLNTQRLELDPVEPLRQELILNLNPAPHCSKTCKSFETSEAQLEGVKALSGLKDLLN